MNDLLHELKTFAIDASRENVRLSHEGRILFLFQS